MHYEIILTDISLRFWYWHSHVFQIFIFRGFDASWW